MKRTLKKILAMLITTAIALSMGVTAGAEEEPAETCRYTFFNLVTGEETQIEIDTSIAQNSASSNMPTSRTVFGDDDRGKVTDTTIYPYKAIALLQTTINGKSIRGTAAAFAKCGVITAAHLVFDRVAYALSSSFKLSFAWNDSLSNPNPTINEMPYGLYIPTEYIENGGDDYDYACFYYNRSITNSYFGWNTGASVGSTVSITGYPTDKNDYCQWTASGPLTAVYTDTIRYTIDTYEGQSGSPVYNSSNQILGVHIGGSKALGYNAAKRLDSSITAFLSYLREIYG